MQSTIRSDWQAAILVAFCLVATIGCGTQPSPSSSEMAAAPSTGDVTNESIERMLERCDGSLETKADFLLQHADQFAKHDLRELTVYHADDDTIRALAKIKSLESLTFRNLSSYTDLAPLAALKHLQSLEAGRAPDLDVTTLGGLKSLTSLALYGHDQDLQFLRQLPRLTSLGLAYGRDSLPIVGQLKSLTSLSLLGGAEGMSLEPLANLNQLAELSLRNCRGLNDLSPLGSIENLAALTIHKCDQLTDLRPLGQCRNIKSLDLNSNECDIDLSPLILLGRSGANDFGPVAGVDSLRTLEATIIFPDVADVEFLARLKGLESIDLYIPVRVTQSLTPLAEARDLTSLRLRQCHGLTSLAVLGGTTSSSRWASPTVTT